MSGRGVFKREFDDGEEGVYGVVENDGDSFRREEIVEERKTEVRFGAKRVSRQGLGRRGGSVCHHKQDLVYKEKAK